MAESTFSDSLYWLDDLTGTNGQNHVANESDKRKWGTLNDLPEPFFKHFNNGGTDDLLAQLGKKDNEVSDSNKRKEQNRAAQRAFRERRQLRVKELEDKVVELEQSRINETKHLQEENQALRLKVKRMEAEIYTLQGAEKAFKLSIQKLREAGIQLPTDTITSLPTPPTSESSIYSISTPSNQQQQQQQLNTSPYPVPDNITNTPSSPSSSSSLSPPIAVDQSTERFLEDHSRQSSTTPSKKGTGHSDGQHSPNSSSNYNKKLLTGNTFIMEDDDSIGFAASEIDRFNHQQDPLVVQGARTIPYSQIWEKVQDHPKYDLFDIDLLCEDLKKKAKCSGSGPVILEEDFLNVLEKYDV